MHGDPTLALAIALGGFGLAAAVILLLAFQSAAVLGMLGFEQRFAVPARNRLGKQEPTDRTRRRSMQSAAILLSVCSIAGGVLAAVAAHGYGGAPGPAILAWLTAFTVAVSAGATLAWRRADTTYHLK